MIVKVGGLLYIVTASLSLLSLFKTAGALGTGSVISTLVIAAFNGAIGVGLLQYANWARWLALGVSLLTWTLGSIGMLFVLTYGLKFMFAGTGGMAGFIALMVIIVGGICAVIIVINFKLFHYLRTEEAKDEFDTPEFESSPVLKSTGLYIAMVIVLAVFESIGRGSSIDRARMRSAMNETAADAARGRELASKRREAETLTRSLDRERQLERDREESNRRKLEELSRVASDAEAELERERREAMNQFRSEQRRLAEQRRADGASQAAASGSTESGSNGKILKCRDASGSVQFTQGYCPPGTTLVPSPPSE